MELIERISILRRILSNIKIYQSEIVSALKGDLGKGEFESYMCEIGVVLDELNCTLKHIKKWTKRVRVRTPLKLYGSKSYIYHKPYGSVLIISPWNYPFMLTLAPIISAVAAGNAVSVKMSKDAKATALVVQKILEGTGIKFIDVESFGADLLEQNWDYIFFTGSKNVGMKVMESAAKNLTPITLELGGKCPCVILKSADLELAAKKIAWGKFVNAGQTCVAPDYVIIRQEYKDRFVELLMAYIKEFYTSSANSNELYPKIINSRHYDRLLSLIKLEQSEQGRLVYGGQGDHNSNKIEPTIIETTLDGVTMQDEIFGPILPIVIFGDDESIVEYVTSKDSPLALYVFGDKKHALQLASDIRAGGCCINDVLVHVANHNLPFGGVGASGMGKYHGKAGFDTFTHSRATVISNRRRDLNLRYPPYDKKPKTYKLMRLLSKDTKYSKTKNVKFYK